jgi:SAM-dependent methyltransferase
MEVPKDWWKGFFSGLAVEMWRAAITEEQTRREADFLEKILAVQPGAAVLDVPCGGGRLSLELARRGNRMTGVEFSDAFVEEARAASRASGLDITWSQRNMQELPWQEAFEGAFCFGNSFGYCDEGENLNFLAQVAKVLKPGARFVLETYCAEFAARTFQERTWFEAGGIVMMEENEYDLLAGGVKTEYTFVAGGRMEKKRGWQRMYSYCELVQMLTAAGFEQVEGYSSVDLEPLNLKSGRLLIVACRSTAPSGQLSAGFEADLPAWSLRSCRDLRGVALDLREEWREQLIHHLRGGGVQGIHDRRHALALDRALRAPCVRPDDLVIAPAHQVQFQGDANVAARFVVELLEIQQPSTKLIISRRCVGKKANIGESARRSQASRGELGHHLCWFCAPPVVFVIVQFGGGLIVKDPVIAKNRRSLESRHVEHERRPRVGSRRCRRHGDGIVVGLGDTPAGGHQDGAEQNGGDSLRPSRRNVRQ